MAILHPGGVGRAVGAGVRHIACTHRLRLRIENPAAMACGGIITAEVFDVRCNSVRTGVAQSDVGLAGGIVTVLRPATPGLWRKMTQRIVGAHD